MHSLSELTALIKRNIQSCCLPLYWYVNGVEGVNDSLIEKVETLTDSGKPSVLRTKPSRLYLFCLGPETLVYLRESRFEFALGHWTDQATRAGRCGLPVGSAGEPSSREFPHTLVMLDWGRRPRISSCVGHARTEQELKQCLSAISLPGGDRRGPGSS